MQILKANYLIIILALVRVRIGTSISGTSWRWYEFANFGTSWHGTSWQWYEL